MKKSKIVKLIIAIIMIILSIICYKYVLDMNIVPNKYLIALITILIILNMFGMLFLFLKGVVTKVLSSIFYIIILVVSIFGIKYSKKTIDYLNKGFNNSKEVNNYDVIVLKTSKYEQIKDLENTSMGYLLSEIDNEKYLDKIKETVNVTLKELNIYDLYKNLQDKKVDSILINEGYLDLLEEQFSDFSSNTKIIYTYSIEEEKVKDETLNNDNNNDNNDNNDNSVVINKRPKNNPNSINIYLSGSDSRSNYIQTVSRSDVNMIMTINPDNHTILLTNIPRDYYVQLHGTSGLRDKLTHAGIYGINMSKTTLEDLFGINIDYTIKIGFTGVIKLIDLVGGIDIDSDASFRCYTNSSVYVNKGMNHFNGVQALAYARERYAYLEGDRHRGSNQQQVIEATFNKLSSDKSLLLKYDTLLDSFSSLYVTDIPQSVITTLIKNQIDKMPSWNIERQAVDGTGASKQTYSMPGMNLYVMEPNYSTVTKAADRISELY